MKNLHVMVLPDTSECTEIIPDLLTCIKFSDVHQGSEIRTSDAKNDP